MEVVKAKEGYTYTKNGVVIGKELYLGVNDSISNYLEESDEVIAARQEEEADAVEQEEAREDISEELEVVVRRGFKGF